MRGIVLLMGLFQVVFLYSIVDIYFQSPVVHGMLPVAAPQPAPSTRLVLFVADGLRADRFFETDPSSGRSRVPWLRSVMERRGAFGVSHTRVPTESRPGHVALLAGIYEDVSAVTRGWKSNPVHFDTVLNRTAAAWGLGSPDIVPMFADSVPHMTALVYDADEEDFASDANHLDTWVFEAWRERVLPLPQVNASRTMHFLHLLGIDTHGHAFRPDSRNYLNNIERVDRGVQQAFETMEARFPDGRTAYLFTSDHGMSDKGSHGAGDPSETETPFVAWGAGVRGPLPSSAGDIVSPRNWEVDHLRRTDVEQADLAPFMATLLGLELPVNSVGKLPVTLLADSLTKDRAMQSNARQMLELLRVKHALRRASSLWFVPSPALEEAEKLLQQSLHSADSAEALLLAAAALETARSGLRYYDQYYRLFLYSVVSAALGGWLLCLNGAMSGRWAAPPCSERVWRTLQAAVVVAWASLLLLLERAPLMHAVYVLCAVALASEGLLQWRAAAAKLQSLETVAGLAVLQCLVLGFFWRPVFAIVLAALALVAWLQWRQAQWAAALALMGLFPLISPSFGRSDLLALVGGTAWIVIAWFRHAGWAQVALCAAAAANVALNSRLLSWAVVAASAATAIVDRDRKSGLALAVAPVYVLLSVAYESLFLCVLLWVLAQWRPAAPGRTGLLFLLFAYTTFFGTGNTGSLSSFEISSTYRFVTVFSPFLMAALLLIKAVLPIVLVGDTFARMEDARGEAKLVLVEMSNVMAFAFFFLVRDEGSWRDIGLSISHFVIANVQTLLALVFYALWKR